MFTHVRLASADIERSRNFYDAVLGALGIPAGIDVFDMLMYQNASNRMMVGRPLSGEPTASNGATLGFAAATPEQVDAFFEAGLAHGGESEGEPGPRPGPANRYAAYLRDPDGNKICALATLGG